MMSWLKSLLRHPAQQVIVHLADGTPIFIDTHDVDGQRAIWRTMVEEHRVQRAKIFYKRAGVWLVDEFTQQRWVMERPGDPGAERETN